MREIAGVKLYTVPEAAELLGVTPQTVRSYVKLGKLKGERVGRHILIPEAGIKALLGGPVNNRRKTEELEEEEILKRILELFGELEDETQGRLLSTLLRKAKHETEVIAGSKQ